jgi:hypothetical protein
MNPTIISRVLPAVIVLSIYITSVLAQSYVPRFKDYPTGEIYGGPTARLVLKKRDLTFKSRLQWAAENQKPNFAGHYILTSWGCGAECCDGRRHRCQNRQSLFVEL